MLICLTELGRRLGAVSYTHLVIAAATVGSAVGLHAAMDRSTQSYVKDVAAQLAADIDGRLKNNSDELELVGDSLIRMQDRGNEAVRDYLQRKSAILDLDFMAVIGMDGTAVSTSEAVENLRELPGIREMCIRDSLYPGG